MDAARIERSVREVLEAEPAVAVAWLFGSVVRATAGPLSDIDVGVLLGECDSPDDRLGSLADRLVLRLGTERIDLVHLATAPVPLRYRAILHGRVLLCRDPLARERFEVDTIRRYLDFKPLRDRALALVRDAILRSA